MIHHLFLSPHFDDALGSCGGTIWRLVNLGEPVRVVTAFGGIECEQLSELAKVLHDKWWKLEHPVSCRRSEDASACAILGCESAFFEFSDAIYRRDAEGRHLYPTFESLHRSVAREDRAIAEHLVSQLDGYLSDENSVIYCPMAIGGHVDHILARDCGQILEARDHAAVVYYRDFYYDRTWDGTVEDKETGLINIILTPEELGKKVAAFSEYASQISGLFGSRAGMIAYFSDAGSSESIFLPKQQIEKRLGMLRSVLSVPGSSSDEVRKSVW